MSLLPKTHAARIAWFQSRTPLWTSNASEIGTTAPEVAGVETLADDAAAALAAQEVAQNAAKAATETLLSAMAALSNAGMAIVEQVRTKARSAGDGVYPLANIPAPATPTTRPPPGQPTDLQVKLGATGELELAWTCANPPNTSGTTYNVFRRLGATGSFTYVGSVGLRKWTDTTVPAGSSLVMYRIQAVRSTAAGPFNTFNVFLGVDGVGGTPVVTTVMEAMGKNAA